MSTQFAIDPKLDFVIERFIDAPPRLVWEALTKPEHLKEWYMPKAWGRVSRAEMDVRPGGIFRIDIATGDGQDFPNLGCFLDVIPMQRLVWTSMLFPGYRPAVFDDIPITAIVTLESVGTSTRYVFTALHRDEADFEKNKESGWQELLVGFAGRPSEQVPEQRPTDVRVCKPLARVARKRVRRDGPVEPVGRVVHRQGVTYLRREIGRSPWKPRGVCGQVPQGNHVSIALRGRHFRREPSLRGVVQGDCAIHGQRSEERRCELLRDRGDLENGGAVEWELTWPRTAMRSHAGLTVRMEKADHDTDTVSLSHKAIEEKTQR
jgi:uncharacterized protein YndB with AHSA1/START domain